MNGLKPSLHLFCNLIGQLTWLVWNQMVGHFMSHGATPPLHLTTPTCWVNSWADCQQQIWRKWWPKPLLHMVSRREGRIERGRARLVSISSLQGREHCQLDIYLFHEVLDHIARVDRVLTSPGGSLLLSGQSGVGRHSAVHLVAFMHQLDVATPHVSRSYSLKHFKNDLKSVC